MQYYLLEYSDDSVDNLPQDLNPIVVNSYELHGFDHRSLWRGKKIEYWDEEIRLYYENGEVALDYIPNVLSWLIFSDTVIELFNSLGISGIQRFPVIISKVGKNDEHFQSNVINVLDSLSVMNWEKSDYVSWDDDPTYIKYIRKLVINRSNISDNFDIFCLAESKNYIIVSERVKKEMELCGITGFGFCHIDVI